MVLPVHITIAFSSLIFTGFLLVSPSKTKLNASYALVALTLISGFYLIFSQPADMTQTCISGLTYLALVGAGIIHAHRKLASVK